MEKVLTSDFTPLAIDLNSNPTPNPTSHELREELDRVKSENKKLSEMLIHVKRDYENLMQSRLSDQGSDGMPKAGGYKRKLALDDDTKIPEYYNGNITSSQCSCSCNGFISTAGAPKLMKSNVSKVYVRIDPSDVSLVVKDGYQWRKYGQKVTRDNPSPRAYYKCCFSPTCPAKKKVQRSVDDPSLLVATYEGDHQHHAAAASPTAISKTKLDLSDGCPKNLNSKDSMTYDKVQKAIANNDNCEVIDLKLLASLLTRNRAFTDALAAAITGKILDEVVSENNNDDVSNSMIMSD